MKSKSCGWRIATNLGHRCYGRFRRHAHMKDNSHGVSSYMEYVADAASLEAYQRQEENPLLSAETLPENTGLVDFANFAREYPERLFPLLAKLRPEFQEFFIEYYILHKPQSFIGETHGCIQTRIWQALRIIERTIGSLIILGPEPSEETLYEILHGAGMDSTPYGSLSKMIVLYSRTQSYADVAKTFHVPAPSIRKIFRPAIQALMADKEIKTVAVGAYLRNLTHQSSLTKTGISKRARARLRRMKVRKFTAPPLETSPLLSFGATDSLKDTPWHMLEISSEHRMTQITPLLQTQGRRAFGKKPGQIFAPMNPEGELLFGYIFARSASTSSVRMLTHIRGISNLVAQYDGDGEFTKLVSVPHADVQAMLQSLKIAHPARIRPNDYVEILSGPAAHYCGTVADVKGSSVTVEVNFLTERRFKVSAEVGAVKILPRTAKRTFWGF